MEDKSVEFCHERPVTELLVQKRECISGRFDQGTDWISPLVGEAY